MKKEEQQEQQIFIVDQDEETSPAAVSFMDFLKVLFGRKILLLIVTASLFVFSSLAILLVNNRASTYVGSFNYSVSNFSQGSYLDGSRFDIRDFITLEKLNKYKSEHKELENLNMEKIHLGNGIVSLTYETTYQENKNKKSADDNDYILAYEGYEIILKKGFLSGTEARVLTEAIAREALSVANDIADKADYSQLLSFYEKTSIYDRQIDYLNQQYQFLYNKYDSLIKVYGDVTLQSGLKISDARVALKEYFNADSFTGAKSDDQSAYLSLLKSELDYNGYVKDYENYSIQLEKQIDSLQREKNVADLKKQELISQRNTLLTASDSLNTVELTAYNEEIIKLSNRIIDIDEEIALVNLKLANKDREKTDADYASDLNLFKAKLQNCYTALTEMTASYQEIEKEVVKNNTVVYFKNNSVVEKQNAIKVYFFIPIALVGSFVVALIVNLCIDGKKLSAKYREKENQPKEVEVKE